MRSVGCWSLDSTSSVLCLLLGWAQTCACYCYQKGSRISSVSGRGILILHVQISHRKIIKRKWWDIRNVLTGGIFEQIISCVCLCQRIVFDQASSHCVAVSRLTAGVKSSNYKIRNLKMSSACVCVCGSSQCSFMCSVVSKVKQSEMIWFVHLDLCVCVSVCVYAKTKWLIYVMLCFLCALNLNHFKFFYFLLPVLLLIVISVAILTTI